MNTFGKIEKEHILQMANLNLQILASEEESNDAPIMMMEKIIEMLYAKVVELEKRDKALPLKNYIRSIYKEVELVMNSILKAIEIGEKKNNVH